MEKRYLFRCRVGDIVSEEKIKKELEEIIKKGSIDNFEIIGVVKPGGNETFLYLKKKGEIKSGIK